MQMDQMDLLDVAFLPSKRPMRAGRVEPLHTVIKWGSFGPMLER